MPKALQYVCRGHSCRPRRQQVVQHILHAAFPGDQDKSMLGHFGQGRCGYRERAP